MNTKQKFDTTEEIKAYCIGLKDAVPLVLDESDPSSVEYIRGFNGAIDRIIAAIED